MSPPSTIPVMPLRPITAPSPIPMTVTTVTLPLPNIPSLPLPPRAHTPAPAPTPAPTTPVRPSIPPKQLPPKLPRNLLHVHKITIPAAVTVILLILPASRLPKIRHGREISDNGPARIEPPLQGLQGRGGLVLLLEQNIDVANHVVGEVVADVEALHLAELVELLEYVLVEILEVGLDLARVQGLPLGVDTGGDHVGSLVHVGEEEGWGDCGTVVETRATVSVTARADLEVERAVHSVLFGSED